MIVEPDETSAAVALGPEEAAVNVDDASPSEPMRDGAGEVLGGLRPGVRCRPRWRLSLCWALVLPFRRW